MRLITDEQHAQIVDALDFVCHDGEREVPKISLTEALAALQALPKVEVVGWTNPNHDYLAPLRRDTIFGSHTLPLYATKEPS